MYKEALIIGLRTQTLKGELSVERLMTTDTETLIICEEGLQELVKTGEKGGRRSKRGRKSNEAIANELRLKIVTDILDDREAAAEANANKLKAKEHNDKIDSLIAAKKESALSELSIEELEKQRL